MMALLGTLVVREDQWARPFLAFRPLSYIGMVSYGVYIYHMWVVQLMGVGYKKIGRGLLSPDYYIAVVIVSIAIAGLSFHVIERPLLKLKSRFASDHDPGTVDEHLLKGMETPIN